MQSYVTASHWYWLSSKDIIRTWTDIIRTSHDCVPDKKIEINTLEDMSDKHLCIIVKKTSGVYINKSCTRKQF